MPRQSKLKSGGTEAGQGTINFAESSMEEQLLKAIRDSANELKDKISTVCEEITDVKRELRNDIQKVSERFEEDLKQVKDDGERKIEEK